MNSPRTPWENPGAALKNSAQPRTGNSSLAWRLSPSGLNVVPVTFPCKCALFLFTAWAGLIAVFESTGGEILTLVTCYPFYFVGPAPNRFIVRAERVTGAAT